MWRIFTASFASFVAAKRSHLAILVICVALIRKGASTQELLDALRTLCGEEQKEKRKAVATARKRETSDATRIVEEKKLA